MEGRRQSKAREKRRMAQASVCRSSQAGGSVHDVTFVTLDHGGGKEGDRHNWGYFDAAGHQAFALARAQATQFTHLW